MGSDHRGVPVPAGYLAEPVALAHWKAGVDAALDHIAPTDTHPVRRRSEAGFTEVGTNCLSCGEQYVRSRSGSFCLHVAGCPYDGRALT